ncbi:MULTISPECIES: creatininase family protein [Flavobacteriaceae]|uniref:creatininase family protein n=1 Tax=Flavobacteriaceae TaxID=49546 RepID=UPI002349E704|nr:creatininase family protein [Muricauda sp. SP22]MDC6364102.1 creatininase family protein [Muricauda sp. SP22]
MKYLIYALVLVCSVVRSQEIPSRWDELTASDWENALVKSNYTCILPIGILEKHGPGVPIGSDLIRVREWSARATKQEYAVVFPDYFYGQVNEAKQQYGTFSLPSKLAMELLEETTKEIARNGFKRIIIINGHGGNPQMIRYFIQNQLEKRRDYAVYFFEPNVPKEVADKMASIRKSDPVTDQHGGENEASAILYLRPDLMKQERSTQESGANQGRLNLSSNIYTAIWWYAAYPNHYAGDASVATVELGKVITENVISSLVSAIKEVKNDVNTLKLQEEYFDRVKK